MNMRLFLKQKHVTPAQAGVHGGQDSVIGAVVSMDARLRGHDTYGLVL
jgi:hypothetical protein